MPFTFNGTTYSDDEVRQFFAQNPTNEAIAKQAQTMGLSASQVQQAAQIAGKNWTVDDINSWAGSNGYGTSTNAAVAPGNGVGMWVGGKWLPKADITAFYANGGDDNQFAQQNGITDPWQRRELILQARQIGGASNYSGDAALQTYFNRYKQYNPNGKYVNDFSGWVGDQATHTLDAMKSGTYTGVPSAPSDSAPGGIYGPGTGHDYSFEQGRYGTGAHGTGDGWAPWSGVAGENRAGQPGTTTTYYGSGGRQSNQPTNPPARNSGDFMGGGVTPGGFTPYWGGSPWWGGWSGNGNMGGGYPVGQYAWGQTQRQPTRNQGYGSWPGYPGAVGGGYRPAGSNSQVTGSDRMYGDYTNGW